MKKCPKCGKENDDDAIFCDACDWKLNMMYAKDGDVKYLLHSRLFAIGAVIFGLLSILFFVFDVYVGAAVFGAFGMFLGGYTQSFVRVLGVKDEKKNLYTTLSIVGLGISVVGFMFGFANLF